MNLAEMLAQTVTPLFDVKPTLPDNQAYRAAVSVKREAAMIARYRKVMKIEDKEPDEDGNKQCIEISTQDVGKLVKVSKPMIGLRKLEGLGHVKMARMSSAERGRKQCMWRWINE